MAGAEDLRFGSAGHFRSNDLLAARNISAAHFRVLCEKQVIRADPPDRSTPRWRRAPERRVANAELTGSQLLGRSG
jgi:hypothetical protein